MLATIQISGSVASMKEFKQKIFQFCIRANGPTNHLVFHIRSPKNVTLKYLLGICLFINSQYNITRYHSSHNFYVGVRLVHRLDSLPSTSLITGISPVNTT